MLLAGLGDLLIFLGVWLPWFFFAGAAEYYWGRVEVSGWISAIGIGGLERTSAKVTMWSTPTYWSTSGSDFWFGYLTILGLILIVTSIVFFIKKDRPRVSMLLVLMGSSIVISASLIAIMYYKPCIFVIYGQIDALSANAARLYASQATVNISSGAWLPIIGSVISVVSMAYHPKTRCAR